MFLTPVFKDYEKHIKDIEEKFKNTKSSEEGSSTKEKETPAAASKPLLGKDYYFFSYQPKGEPSSRNLFFVSFFNV